MPEAMYYISLHNLQNVKAEVTEILEIYLLCIYSDKINVIKKWLFRVMQ